MSIVVTTVSVSAIATLLAVFVVFADRFLNDYGECTIDVNDGTRVLQVNGGSSLLNTLASQRIFVSSACGGKATCGLCKVQLLEDVGPVLPTEEPFLTQEEIEDGVRLSCQIKVKKDLRLYIPEELFNVKQYKAVIQRITQMTHDIKEFSFSLNGPEPLSFKAGQYVQIDSKPYDSVQEEVTRAYSIASVPSNQESVDLIIRLVPGGVCTTFMHDHVKEGDTVTLRGPFGDFYLREGADELVLIAGGSGLAPIKAMVFDILEKGLNKNMTFFFGAVTKKDLYYVELFSDLAAKHDNFSFIPALSNPDAEDNWDGETGLITEVVERYVRSPDNTQAYLCGSPGMINACIEVLGRIGIQEDAIFFDKFS